MAQIDRRAFLGLAAMLGLSGCAAKAGPAEVSWKPVTVKHAFGESTVASSPQRVVCLGMTSHDVCLALGIVPVALTVFEATDFKLTAWFEKKLTKMSGAWPELMHSDEEPTATDLRQLSPDVILAVNSDIGREQYDAYSSVAPVIAYPGEPWNTDFETSTRMVSEALGKADRADRLISKTLDRIESELKPYASFAGDSAAYIRSTTISGADIDVYGSGSNRMRALDLFGLSPASKVTDLEGAGQLDEHGSDSFSPEEVSAMRPDVFIAAVPGDEWYQAQKKQIVAEELGIVPERIVQLAGDTDDLALAECSPLSLQYAVQSVIPQIAKSRYLAGGA